MRIRFLATLSAETLASILGLSISPEGFRATPVNEEFRLHRYMPGDVGDATNFEPSLVTVTIQPIERRGFAEEEKSSN